MTDAGSEFHFMVVIYEISIPSRFRGNRRYDLERTASQCRISVIRRLIPAPTDNLTFLSGLTFCCQHCSGPRCGGATANAGVENAIPSKMQEWKMREVNSRGIATAMILFVL